MVKNINDMDTSERLDTLYNYPFEIVNLINQTEDDHLAIISTGHGIQYYYDFILPTDNVNWAIIESDPRMILVVDNPTIEMCEYAIKSKPALTDAILAKDHRNIDAVDNCKSTILEYLLGQIILYPYDTGQNTFISKRWRLFIHELMDHGINWPELIVIKENIAPNS